MNDEGVNSSHFGNMLLHFECVCVCLCVSVCSSGVDELPACLYVFCFFVSLFSLSFVGLLVVLEERSGSRIC